MVAGRPRASGLTRVRADSSQNYLLFMRGLTRITWVFHRNPQKGSHSSSMSTHERTHKQFLASIDFREGDRDIEENTRNNCRILIFSILG